MQTLFKATVLDHSIVILVVVSTKLSLVSLIKLRSKSTLNVKCC